MRVFWKCALYRSLRTVCQTLASMIPVGTIVTPSLIQSLDWSFLYVVMAWIGTALLSGVASLLTSIATGLPEVEHEHNLYMSADEPEDSEVSEDGQE